MTSISAKVPAARHDAVYACPMHPHISQAEPGSCPLCGMALQLKTGGPRIARSLLFGALAFAIMMAVYFGVLTLVSGWDFTLSEFLRFWPYVVALALGFGLQIALYVHLRQQLAHHHGGGGMLVASGTTSTAAMLACCTHYLTNVLPIIGAAGLVTLAAEYQVELFWVGLAFNAAGIVFVGSRILQAGRHA